MNTTTPAVKNRAGSRRGWFLPIGVFLVLAGVSVASYVVGLTFQTEAFHDQMDALGKEYANRTEVHFANRLAYAEGIGERLQRLDPERREARYVREASFLLKRLGGIQAVNYVEPDGRISRVMPDDGTNDQAKGKNLLERADLAPILTRAQDQRMLVATPTLELYQGGRGIACYYALFDEQDAPAGWINIVFRVSDTIEACFAKNVPSGVELRFFEDRSEGLEEVYLLKTQGELFEDLMSRRVPISVAGSNWQVQLVPTLAFANRRHVFRDDVILILGLITAFAAAFFLDRSINAHRLARESQHEAEEIITNSPLQIFVKDLNGVYFFQSARGLEAYGMGSARIVGKNDFQILAQDLAERNTALDLQVKEKNASVAVDENLKIDGRVRHYRTIRFPLHHADGTLRAICGVSIDLTDEREQLAELREREAYFRRIHEQMPVMLYVLDASGRIVTVSNYWLATLGYQREEVLGREIRELLTKDSYTSQYLGYVSKLRNDGKTQNLELEFQLHDGAKLPVTNALMAEYNNKGQLQRILGVATDMSERNQALRELEELNRELEKRVERRTTRLEAAIEELRAFTYSVSHDLRAPLRAISGFSRMLSEGEHESLDPAQVDCLQRIQSAAAKMTNLVDDLLRLSSISHAELTIERFSISTLATEAFEEVLQDTGTSKKVIFSAQEDLVTRADRRLVKILLTNLFDNALKYSAGMETPEIRFEASFDGGVPVYHVHDNGAGFAPERAETITRPFARLHSPDEFKGTGIGLATVNRIILRHGGWLRAESQQGKGASFAFTLGSAPQFVS